MKISEYVDGSALQSDDALVVARGPGNVKITTLRGEIDGKEDAGTAASAVAAHEAAGDPHTGYLTPAEGDAAYEPLGALADHEAAADPHPGYLTPTEADAAYVPVARTVAGKALSANVTLVKGDVGLGNVDNTSDAAKPVSTAQQTALDAKQATSAKNAASGYAGLDGSSKLTGSQQVYGSASNTACVGNDARLSDARTPLIASAADGDIIMRSGSAWVRLAKGTDGQVLKLASGLPAWGTDNTSEGGGGSISYQEADRATDLALTTTYAAATSLSLAAGTWLVIGQSSIESTSTTQGNCSIRLRDTTNSVTYSIAECEVDSALPDRASLMVHAVIVLAGTATIALEGRQSAGTSHMIGPGNLGDTGTKVTRITAVKIG